MRRSCIAGIWERSILPLFILGMVILFAGTSITSIPLWARTSFPVAAQAPVQCQPGHQVGSSVPGIVSCWMRRLGARCSSQVSTGLALKPVPLPRMGYGRATGKTCSSRSRAQASTPFACLSAINSSTLRVCRMASTTS